MVIVIGKTFGSVKYSRKDKVTPFSVQTNGIRINNKIIDINPQQLFNRIVCIVKDPLQLKSYFQYELASKPLSIFDDVSMRKGTKSSILNLFQETRAKVPNNLKNVVDGGYLLHVVVWPKPATYETILNLYCDYVVKHFGKNCIVVFDGYADSPTTKGEEHRRRAIGKSSADLAFTVNMAILCSQTEFLSNQRNKDKLIKLLMNWLREKEVATHQAEHDADVSIVSYRLEFAKQKLSTCIIGQDSDLLILATALYQKGNIWFRRPAMENKRTEIVHNIANENKRLISDVLLFLHAMTGCDTTSSFYHKGKIKEYNIFKENEQLQRPVKIFNQKNASKFEIAKAGEKFILVLYGNEKCPTLDDLRFQMYRKKISTLDLHSKFDLTTLPPTTAAAMQHSYRVYYQVQTWMGEILNPTDWGWHINEGALLPTQTLKPPAPENLLKLMFCQCKANCTSQCECKRSDLSCSALCGHCEGVTCENSRTNTMEIEEEN